MYSNKERDEESKLDYFEARYYDSEVGRFRSIDRVYWDINKEFLANPKLQNSYGYVGNNPIKYIDTTGLWLETSDATSMFQTYIYKGENLSYNSKWYYDGPIEIAGITIFKESPFKTMSDTLSAYILETLPGSTYDLKTNTDFMQKIDLNGNGKYDYNQTVQINGKDYKTNELGNFMVGLNGYRAGLTKKEIFNYGLAGEAFGLDKSGVTKTKLETTLKDEKYDQKFYVAGYVYGIIEKSGKYTQEKLEYARDYLLNKAKNGDKEKKDK